VPEAPRAEEANVTADFTFTYHSAQRERFRSGSLAEEWRSRYPEIFDQADLNLVRNQPLYHFFEWLSAVLIYEATGWLSLVESYTAGTHPNKRSKLRALVGDEIFEQLDLQQSGQPDLFVYQPGTDQWFFCEVKGGPDKERDNQKAWRNRFLALLERHKMKGARVRMIQLKEIKL
jgi:hypothetical protein